MEFREFTAGKDDDGRRLDRVLRIFLKEKSLNEIYKLIRKGLIKVNQKKTKADSHVAEGDLISIAAFLFDSEKSEEKITESKIKLNIIFENQHLLIIDKPYGYSVHGSQNENQISLEKEVSAYLQAKNEKPDEKSLSFKPGPLHRLDRNTTGLLAFSKSLEGAQWFSDCIKDHTIGKKYTGIAEGNLTDTENWEDKLADSEERDGGFYTVSKSEKGSLAITTARPLAHGKLNGRDLTLVEYSIKTGRKHQIRAQSSLHGHSLAGDRSYGGKQCQELKREYYLHACSLTFPADNPLELPQIIKCPLPDDFIHLLECCEIKNPEL